MANNTGRKGANESFLFFIYFGKEGTLSILTFSDVEIKIPKPPLALPCLEGSAVRSKALYPASDIASVHQVS